MRRKQARAMSPRSGMFASLGVVLVVGLAIAIECQPFTRTAHGLETRPAVTTAQPAPQSTLTRTGSSPRQSDRLPATMQASRLAPVWKRGFEWHYRWSDPRGTGTYIRAVAAEDTLEGLPVYVVRTGSRRIYWSKAELAWLMEQVDGKVESQAVPPYQRFAWPMEPGKTWVARYQWAHPGEAKTEDRVRRHRVAALESVQVPAGNFQALRVVVTDSSGKKVSEYWYAPEARWLVKERSYLAQGVRERELIYVSLWPNAPAR
jgi:hypothetical protein